MTYRSLAHAARAHLDGEVVTTPPSRSLAHAARAHINGERIETPAKPSLAHSARIQVDEHEIARRQEIVTLSIKPNSLSDIASRIGRLNEADDVGEKGVISSTDNTTAGGPPETEPKTPGKKKKASTPNPDDPDSLTFGIGNPVDLAPTTDNPATTANSDAKDKKVVEAAGVHESKEEKTFPKGIQLGNYHRNIRSRVMKIMATNQNLVKKHGIIPAEPKNEEVELAEAGFDPFKATGQLVQMALLGGHYDRRRNYSKKVKMKAKTAEPESHPNDNTPLPPVPVLRPVKKPVVSMRTDGTITHITPGGKGGFKASDAIARYRERLRRGETTKKPLFGPNGEYQKRNWAESVE